MTTFLFLRHAHSTANGDGVLAGRIEGIDLSDEGRRQADEMATHLHTLSIQRVFSSPLERCLQTLEPYRTFSKKRIERAPALIEMDYGSWSGEKLTSLARKPLWRTIKKKPDSVTFPDGESFLHAWRRIERFLTNMSREYPKSTLLICSHGDIIKMAITMTLRAPLNSFQSVVVDPASLSVAVWEGKERSLLSSNQRFGKKRNRAKKTRVVTTMKNRKVLGGGSGG